MHETDDERMTIAVPRLRREPRERRDSVLSTSGRLMPLRRLPTEPHASARGSRRLPTEPSVVSADAEAAADEDDYESVSVEPTRTEIVIDAAPRRAILLPLLVVALAAAVGLAVAAALT